MLNPETIAQVFPSSVQRGQSDKEFELFTNPDNGGTEFETGHRTWFYFGVSGVSKGEILHFTMMNLNRQGKLYNNDFRPFYR